MEVTDTPDEDPVRWTSLPRAFAQVMGTPPDDRAEEEPQPPVAEAATGADELQPEPQTDRPGRRWSAGG